MLDTADVRKFHISNIFFIAITIIFLHSSVGYSHCAFTKLDVFLIIENKALAYVQ